MKRKPIKVEERKLKQGCWGYAVIKERKVILHPEHVSEKERLDTLIHECLHLIEPKWRERTIKNATRDLLRVLWKQGYRRIQK